MLKTIEISGYCDPRFASVKEAFRQNFAAGLEVGASFAATVNGKFVVDIWGGYADAAQTKPWQRDTIVNVFSTTKVMTAICALMLVDRGQLDLDAPVAKYWPEFAQNGKSQIPVRYLLSHQSGMAAFEEPIPFETFYDWDQITKNLAAQKPAWEPGKGSGYHAMAFGYLIGEVVRRITGKTIGRFFREEVAIPLKADFFIGLPAENDERVAELVPPPVLKPGDPGYYDISQIDPNLVATKVMINPAGLMDKLPVFANDRDWRRAEIPAANGHGNARSIARVAAAMACGGELDGVRLMGLPTIQKAIEEQSYGIDLVLGVPIRYGLGFGLNCKEMPVGPNPRTFSWGGLGGSSMIMDLDARLSMAYAMNKMGSQTIGDPRSVALGQAMYAAL